MARPRWGDRAGPRLARRGRKGEIPCRAPAARLPLGPASTPGPRGTSPGRTVVLAAVWVGRGVPGPGWSAGGSPRQTAALRPNMRTPPAGATAPRPPPRPTSCGAGRPGGESEHRQDFPRGIRHRGRRVRGEHRQCQPIRPQRFAHRGAAQRGAAQHPAWKQPLHSVHGSCRCVNVCGDQERARRPAGAALSVRPSVGRAEV